jgi:hypothetical protein
VHRTSRQPPARALLQIGENAGSVLPESSLTLKVSLSHPSLSGPNVPFLRPETRGLMPFRTVREVGNHLTCRSMPIRFCVPRACDLRDSACRNSVRTGLLVARQDAQGDAVIHGVLKGLPAGRPPLGFRTQPRHWSNEPIARKVIEGPETLDLSLPTARFTGRLNRHP